MTRCTRTTVAFVQGILKCGQRTVTCTPVHGGRTGTTTDVGGMPQRDFLHAIDLLGTKVLPRIRAELAKP
jgi:hypothetical protein